MPIISKNPATEEVLATFSEFSNAEIKKRLADAEVAFQSWRKTTYQTRATLMKRLGELFRSEKRRLGELATKEMGKPIAAAIAEVEKCAMVCDYYAEEAEQFLTPEIVVTDAEKSYIRFDPLGQILAVMPWNFPYWQVMRFAAPAIMAGNVGLLKHASNVPQSALAIEDLFIRAGFPPGVFQTLLIGAGAVAVLVQDSRVRAVTLTGSERAGSEVASLAGTAIKKTVLELGGSDPFIVFADADLPYACSAGASARLQNNGQSCIAAKRFIIVQDRLEEFVDRYKALYEAQKIGNPLDPEVTIGPLASKNILDEVARQVDESVTRGARIVTGGKRMNRKGYFYRPTILRDVRKGMPAYDEEVFGPVAAIISAKDDADAIRIANDSSLGLGASLWTRDLAKAERYAEEIEAGAVFVNGIVKSDPRLPFGGIKRSGYGRELSGYGIKEFVNIKTVWIGAPQTGVADGPVVE